MRSVLAKGGDPRLRSQEVWVVWVSLLLLYQMQSSQRARASWKILNLPRLQYQRHQQNAELQLMRLQDVPFREWRGKACMPKVSEWLLSEKCEWRRANEVPLLRGQSTDLVHLRKSRQNALSKLRGSPSSWAAACRWGVSPVSRLHHRRSFDLCGHLRLRVVLPSLAWSLQS